MPSTAAMAATAARTATAWRHSPASTWRLSARTASNRVASPRAVLKSSSIPSRNSATMAAYSGAAESAVVLKVERAAVMGAEDQQPHGFAADLRCGVVHGPDVAERLRHLLGAEVHHAVVQPVAGQRPALGTFTLGDLVLVVREDEIVAAAVNVERLAEVLAGHRR